MGIFDFLLICSTHPESLLYKVVLGEEVDGCSFRKNECKFYLLEPIKQNQHGRRDYGEHQVTLQVSDTLIPRQSLDAPHGPLSSTESFLRDIPPVSKQIWIPHPTLLY